METFGNDTEETTITESVNQELGRLENLISVNNKAITALQSKEESDVSSLNTTDNDIIDTVDSYKREVEEFDSRISTNADNISIVSTELSDYKLANDEQITTKDLYATSSINTPKVDTTNAYMNTVYSDKIENSSSIETDSLKVKSSLTLENDLETPNLTVTKTLTANNITVTNEFNSDDILIKKVKSSKEYTDSGYESSEYVAHYTIKPHGSDFIMYSLDSTDQWSIMWNGAICYDEPKGDLQYVNLTSTENQGTIIELYIYHPNKEYNYRLITFGEKDIDIEVETVKIPYDEQNITSNNGVFPSSESDAGVKVKFVTELPDGTTEMPIANTLYVIEHRGTFVWNADTSSWVQLDPFYLDSNTASEDPLTLDYDKDTATLTARTYYSTITDYDLSFVRV